MGNGRFAAPASCALTLWGTLTVCWSLELRHGKLERREVDLDDDVAATDMFEEEFLQARVASFQKIDRVLGSRKPDQPPMSLDEICEAFDLDPFEGGACERVALYLGGASHWKKAVEVHVKELVKEPPDFLPVPISLRDVLGQNDPENFSLVSVWDHYAVDLRKADDAAMQNANTTGLLDKMISAGNRPIIFNFGDGTHKGDLCYPTITKSRTLVGGADGNAVILDLNHDRHWEKVAYTKAHDRFFPLSMKTSRLVWRGTSTGPCNATVERSRMMLVSKYFSSPDPRIDIGISRMEQACTDALPYLKENMTISEQLEAKYILVVEGNDKASGLNWALASDSVPFMVEPRVESWLAESYLRAWVHYVPVKPDFSDLISQLDFADANPGLMKTIAEMGKHHIEKFSNATTEADVEGAVVAAYLDRVVVKPGAKRPDKLVCGSVPDSWGWGPG